MYHGCIVLIVENHSIFHTIAEVLAWVRIPFEFEHMVCKFMIFKTRGLWNKDFIFVNHLGRRSWHPFEIVWIPLCMRKLREVWLLLTLPLEHRSHHNQFFLLGYKLKLPTLLCFLWWSHVHLFCFYIPT